MSRPWFNNYIFISEMLYLNKNIRKKNPFCITQKGFVCILLFLFKHQVDTVDNKAVRDNIKYLYEWHHFGNAVKTMNMDICSY